MSLKSLADIRPKESSKLTEIRVIKKWKPYTADTQKKPDLWFLFVDVHGDAIKATCSVKDAGHFSNLLELQKCYRLSGYISRPARSYMPMLPHQASLFLGLRVDVQPVDNYDIPTYYYNLATFDELNARKAHLKLLTGRVDRVSPELLRKGKRLRKVSIRDTIGNPLEITLWEEKRHLIPPEGTIGKAVVVTSTLVTQYNVMQLESTVSTTVEINPNFPELQSYLDKFSKLDDTGDLDPVLQTLTVTELAERASNPNQRHGKYKCNATITTAHEYRGWFYVNYARCGQRAFEQDDGFICAHCKVPKGFEFSLNTLITDNTSVIEAGFFDDALYSLLGMSCETLVMTKNNKESKNLPTELHTLIGVPLTLTVNIKPNRTLGVDNATRETTMTPATPNPKIRREKRQPMSNQGHSMDKDKPQQTSPTTAETSDKEVSTSNTEQSEPHVDKKQKSLEKLAQ